MIVILFVVVIVLVTLLLLLVEAIPFVIQTNKRIFTTYRNGLELCNEETH